MKSFFVAMTLAAPLVLAAPAVAQEQARDWSQEVGRTPAGGFVMGNPDAPVRLVEFVSMTCNHCAHFSESAFDALVADYVRPGRVAFEIRNHVRDPADAAAALVARCDGGESFFALTDTILEKQGDWMETLRAKPVEELNQIITEQGLDGLVTVSGIDDLAAAQGLSPADRQACLADQAALEALVAMSKRSVEVHGVRGTPSFLVNDRLVGAHDWASLKPLIDAELAN